MRYLTVSIIRLLIFSLFFSFFYAGVFASTTQTTLYLSSLEKNIETGDIRVYYGTGNASAVRNIRNGISSILYIHPDQLSSTVVISRNDGTKETSSVYLPYGNEKDQLNLSSTDKLYTSQRKDTSSDLYFYNARYYNPKISHFISADKAEGPNRYSYVSNNPVMKNDPSGNEVVDEEIIRQSIRQRNKEEREFFNSYKAFGSMIDEFQLSIRDANYDSKEKLDALIMYIFYKIPYAPSLIEVWDNRSRLENELKILRNTQKQFYSEKETFQEDINRLEGIINALGRQEGEIWSMKNKATMYEQYEKQLFVCYNFTDLVSEIANNILGIPTYAAGLPGHAFIASVIDDKLYTGDPTWGLTLRPIEQDIKERPYFEWSKFGYNPTRGPGVGSLYFKDSLISGLHESFPKYLRELSIPNKTHGEIE